MFIYTTKFPKRKVLFGIAVLVLTVLAACFSAFLTSGDGDGTVPAADDAARTAHLRSLGWEVGDTPVESIALALPNPLEEPYLSYNALQLEQGFDLTPYAGENLERHVYTVTNHPSGAACEANLYVCNGVLVAGDILASGKDGFIAPLTFPKQS